MEYIPSKSSYKCILCGKISKSRDRSALLKHIIRMHLEKALHWGHVNTPLCECNMPSNGGNPKHFHCHLCVFVVKSTEGDLLKHHFESVHGIQRKHTIIIPDPVEEPCPSAISETVASLDIMLDEDRDSAETFYQCIVEDCPVICHDSQSIRAHERTHGNAKKADSSLKYMAIDPDGGIFFVRVAPRGCDYKVHVNLSRKYCSGSNCLRDKTLICRHLRSIKVSQNAVEPIFHNIEEEADTSEDTTDDSTINVSIKRIISASKRAEIIALQHAAASQCKPFVVEWSESPASIRNFSVFSSDSERAYVKVIYSRHGDGNHTTWHCDVCPMNKCIHVWTSIWISTVHSSTPREPNPINQNGFGYKYSK